jgi:hypothetical protein
MPNDAQVVRDEQIAQLVRRLQQNQPAPKGLSSL